MGRVLIQRRRNPPHRSDNLIREFTPGEAVGYLDRSKILDHWIQHVNAEPLERRDCLSLSRPILDR